MKRIILIYGLICAAIVIATGTVGILFFDLGDVSEQTTTATWLGYLIMLIALSVIFLGIKRYRDHELGGVISFIAALLTGLGISVVAGVGYVVAWELYLAQTDYAFIDQYVQGVIAQKRANGVMGEALQAVIEQMDALKERYANPLFRLPMTFLEIFPVGVLVSLISAALLRKSQFLSLKR